MAELTWSWLCLPYLVLALALTAVAVLAALVRGDRVMRLGVAGAAITVLPWSICSTVSACTSDPDLATRLLRMGFGPVSLIGANLLIVLLGVSGQLERYRWIARLAAAIGTVLLALCWGTPWMVPGVQRLPSGLLYTQAGPLTALTVSQLAVWLLVGSVIVRRSGTRGERRGVARMLLIVFGLGAFGSLDLLLVHGVWGSYPIAWVPALLAAVTAIYMVTRTDLLRPQGIDQGVLAELLGGAVATVVVGILALALDGGDPLSLVWLATIVWTIALAVTWMLDAQRPVRVAGQRALEEFVARIADIEQELVVAERLAGLWRTVGIEVRVVWRVEGDQLVDITSGAPWPLDPLVASWLATHGDAVAPGDLATIRLGALRAPLEALVATHGATLLVPLVDRGALVGLVEADHQAALREAERGLVLESARAAARAVTYAALARAAAEEGEIAREVEVAQAMRLQATSSRDDELGRWSVAVEYRSAAQTTAAAWSAALLGDGRLAVLVTEAQAHGVASALATAALTGAFSAATSGPVAVSLDELVASLRASADGVMRVGEPIAAFVAVLDADAQRIGWASAGHPGAFVIGAIAYDLAQVPQGSQSGRRPVPIALGGGSGAPSASLQMATRGETALPLDGLLVIASSGVRGDDDAAFREALRDQAPAGPRLAQLLVDGALRRGEPQEDLLAVVVRLRSFRPSGAIG